MILYPLQQLVGGMLRFAGGRSMSWAMALMLFGAMLEGVGLAMLVPLVALLSSVGEPGAGALASFFGAVGIATSLGQLAFLLGCFVVVLVIRAFVLMARERELARLQIGFVEHERRRIIEAVAAAEWSDVSGLRHARVVNALTVNIQRIAVTVQLLMQTVVSLLMLATQLVVTLVLVPSVGLAVLAFIAVGMFRLSFSIRRGLRQGAKIGQSQLGLSESTARLLNGLKVATAENAQNAFVKAFTETSIEMSAGQLAYQRELSRFRAVVSTGIAISGAAVLLLGFWMQGATASLLAALLIVSRMAAPAISIYQNFERIAMLLPAHADIHQLGQELGPMRVNEPTDAVNLSGAIRLHCATYLHADGCGVRDVTLDIAPGEFVGIVGPSGSGKTTLIDLLSSLLHPQLGSLHIGNVPLSRSQALHWRRQIAYVGQEAFLINDTIRANLVWGCQPQDDETLWRALEQAEIAGTVRAMPLGLDTMLAERGLRLSGGERQRIALARALLRQPSLLILDEASNAIDIATEHRIMTRLAALDPRPIILIVAHRTETLRVCTRQIMVADGRVVADRGGLQQ